MIIVMVMVVTMAFLVLVTPYVIQYAVWSIYVTLYDLDNFQMKQRDLSYVITVDLYVINCSIHFFLYFISCKRFRTDIKILFLRK
jgi:hypothetical protein